MREAGGQSRIAKLCANHVREAMKQYGLSRSERLRRARDFQRVMEEGRFFRHPALTMAVRKNGLGFSRVGISVSRHMGKAVCRNRVKRRLREAYRLLKGEIGEPHDLVFFARTPILAYGHRETMEAMRELLRRGNLWAGRQDVEREDAMALRASQPERPQI